MSRYLPRRFKQVRSLTLFRRLVAVFLTKGPSVADASVLAGPAIIDTSYQNVTVSIPTGMKSQ